MRQNFSHGRTKAVVVETKKRKFSLPGDKPEPAAAPSVFTPKPVVAAAPVAQEAPKAPPPPAHNGQAFWIKVAARDDGTFVVSNARNGFSKEY